MLELNSPVTMAISHPWLAIAEQFAAEQGNAQKATQIFGQTLGLLALNKYLTVGGDVATALTESYSWHPQTRILTGWADLLLPAYGRLYCSTHHIGQDIELPPILPMHTLGVVVTSLSDDHQTITLESFIPQRVLYSPAGTVDMTAAQAIATIFDELYLLSEERDLVQTEIQKLTTTDEELKQFFAPFLHTDQLLGIVSRLNQCLEAKTTHPQDVFGLNQNYGQRHLSAYAVSEAVDSGYGEQEPPSAQNTTAKIAEAIATLTTQLLTQTRTLYQDFAASM